MGEVWKARDSRLDRNVAIKILTAEFAQNAQLKLRFEREAKTISQLNHPHICTLYDVGENYLVMELLDGESLADRLTRGPLPIADVLEIGMQIAQALDRAHRAGVTHRDVKPGNIMIGRGGAKLLDFGLAKTEAVVNIEGATEHKPLTQEGTILGTFQYMAPEQLEGVEADARTDIFALGAVLYEMATGNRAFSGQTRTSLIAAIVKEQPPRLSEIQPLTPPALEHVIQKCLEKDPEHRWQSAHDIAEELKWVRDGASQVGVPVATMRRRVQRQAAGWIVAALFGATTVAAVSLYLRHLGGEKLHGTIRTSIVGVDGKPYRYSANSTGPVLSPDGRRFAFVAPGLTGQDTLFVRSLEALEARPLSGTEGAGYPFWSPDSRSLGFFGGGMLKTIDAGGGPVTALTAANSGRGGAWNRDDVIVFAPDITGSLFKVPAHGGKATPATTVPSGTSGVTHRWPSFLPDGKRFLYLESNSEGGPKEEINAIWAGSLDAVEKPVRILPGRTGAIYSQGFLLFIREGFLLGQHFDPKELKVTGEAVTIAEHVRLDTTIIGASNFSASDNGLLLFMGGSTSDVKLSWVDREGKEYATAGKPAPYRRIRLSPDDTRFSAEVVDLASGGNEVWVNDREGATTRRLTFNPANERNPIWSPDGTRIVCGSKRQGRGQLILKSASGSSSEQVLLETSGWVEPQDWSSDGRFILYDLSDKKTDLWVLPLSGDRKPFALVAGAGEEGWALFSPDSKWVLYLSNETGQFEAYAMRFPPDQARSKWQLTNSGANWLVGWRSDGREVYFLDTSNNMSVLPVTLGAEIEAQPPKLLFRTAGNLSWSSSRDGTRFLVGVDPEGKSDSPPTLVVDWPAALKR